MGIRLYLASNFNQPEKDMDSEVYEANAATMLMRRAIGEGWDGYDELEGTSLLTFEHFEIFENLKF